MNNNVESQPTTSSYLCKKEVLSYTQTDRQTQLIHDMTDTDNT